MKLSEDGENILLRSSADQTMKNRTGKPLIMDQNKK
jgi:hypothetical protein